MENELIINPIEEVLPVEEQLVDGTPAPIVPKPLEVTEVSELAPEVTE